MNRELDRGEVQDRLPDLVRGTLPEAERIAVERAIAADADLARELETIRAAHRALTPRVAIPDADRIVASIRRPAPARSGLRVARWRIAAAIATIAVGAASLGVVQNVFRGDGIEPLTIEGGETTLVAAADPLAVSFGYDLSTLDAEALERLFAELEKSGGIPSTTPRTAVVVPPVGGTQ